VPCGVLRHRISVRRRGSGVKEPLPLAATLTWSPREEFWPPWTEISAAVADITVASGRQYVTIYRHARHLTYRLLVGAAALDVFRSGVDMPPSGDDQSRLTGKTEFSGH